MADVNLVVRAHLRGERELNKAERKLLRIAVAAKTADNNMASLGASSQKFAKSLNQTTERFTRIMTDWDKMVKGFGSLITKVLGAATKFMVVEFAAVAASMIVVHGLFKIGRWLMKGYHGAIKMVAGAATGAAAALAVLSSAIREQQAAMFSYKGLEKNYKDLKGGIAAVRMEMRGMATDVTMASMGIENLNTIFAGASQRGNFSKSLTKGLMDIAAAGQPLEQAAKWLGEVVGILTDPKANWSEVRKAFEGMGKMGEETWKKLAGRGINSIAKLQSAIRTGLISEIAGVEGQWDAVSGTLVSRFKAAFTIIRTDFADIGDAFLGDTKMALDEVTQIFRRLLFRIRGDVIRFGKGGLLGGMVDAMEAIERNMVKLVDKWLPMAEGMFGRIADWWDRFTDGWKKVTSSLAPLLSAAKVLEDMFMNILRPVGDYLSESFRNLRVFLIDSKKDFLAHGTAIGDLLTALLSFKTAWTTMFQDAMPFINKLIDGVTELVNLFTGLSKSLGGVVKTIGNVGQGIGGGLGGSGGSGGFGPFLMMMGMRQGFKQIGERNKGTWREQGLNLKNLQNMNVTSANVNINGQPVGGPSTGGKSLSDYGYAPSAAAIGQKSAGAAAAAGTSFHREPGFIGPPDPRRRPLFGASDYLTETSGRGTGYSGHAQQLSMDSAWNAPQWDARLEANGQFRDPTTGRMVPRASAMAALGLGPAYMRPQGRANQGSLFGGSVATGGTFTSLSTIANHQNAPSWADMEGRMGSKGLSAFLGGSYGPGTGGEGQLDFSQMGPAEFTKLVRASKFLPSPDGGIDPSTGQPVQELNPFYGQGVGSSIFGGLRGKMKWRDQGNLGSQKHKLGIKSNLKAAYQRQKMLSTTRISAGPQGPQTRYQKGRTKLMSRLGAGSVKGGAWQRKMGSGAGFGARMGAGMGMGVLSGFMGEEAQGAMNLGSSIAMVNPLLGAAVGLGGAALKSQTTAGGAMSGAGAGAAMGAMIGPGGALAGAVIGGLVGGVMGTFGRGKAQAAEVRASAKETADEIWAGMISGIDDLRASGGPMTAKATRRAMGLDRIGAIISGGTAANQAAGVGTKFKNLGSAGKMGHAMRQAAVQDIYNNQSALGVEMSKEELDKNLRRPFEFLEEILPELTKNHGAANIVLDKYTNRIDHMTAMFDVSEEKLLEMSDTVGVNLYDAAADTTEMMMQLSAALMQTRDQINNVFAEMMSTTYDMLGSELRQVEGELGMDESARAFRESYDRGEIDPTTTEGKKQILGFLREQEGFAKDFTGGDEMAAAAMFNDLFFKGGAFTQAGGPLQGLGGLFQDPKIQAALGAGWSDEKKNQVMQQQVTGNLMGVGLTGDVGDLTGLSSDQMTGVDLLFAQMRLLEKGGSLMSEDGHLTGAGQQKMLAGLAGYGVNVGNLQAYTEGAGTEAVTGEDMAAFATTFKTSVGDFSTIIDDLTNKLNPSGQDTKHPVGDTSSTLAGTLAAHGRISGGLSGKRTITSGYRNYALGSINSDHVTGKALDIVGDNLGAYQQGIKRGGGFAEFHGSGGGRHLHTVPATGDTSTSRGGLGGGSNTNNYTINVSGGPNANAQEVASLVMGEIQNLNRSNRERS